MLRKHPRPHQTEALTAISRAVLDHDRVTTVLACGAGKTLVELWAAQAIGAKRTIVFVPTLSLLQQLFLEWRDQNSWGGQFRSLCVCSDSSVGRRDEDEFDLQVEDLGFPTCTSPGVVNEFLDAVDEESGAHAVVFCTYQSAPVIGQAMSVRGPADRSFGVGIFDEAHKTVGDADRVFSYALHDANLEIDKRLFFTATPRVVNSRGVRDAEGDYLVASMDDPAVYGERAYTLGFAEAARRGVIVPYRVVISVVDDASITEEQLTDSLVMADGHVFNARVLASQVALRRTMDNYGLKKAITFHSTIDSAEDFSRSGRADLGYGFDGMFAEHISGRQSAGVRAAVMQRFREAQAGVLSNAKCLTEGIDVPAVDLVAFIDPKKSKVDIVQAAGRAMRKAGPSKTHGYILLPLHLNVNDAYGDSMDEAMDKSEFATIVEVLRSLAESDDEFYSSLISDSISGSSTLPIEVDLPLVFPALREKLVRAIQTEIVDIFRLSFEVFLERIRWYSSIHNSTEVPQSFKCSDGYPLGARAHKERMRAKMSTYPTEKRLRLESVGFRCDTKTQLSSEASFRRFYTLLRQYFCVNGHCRVPKKYLTECGYALGARCASERKKARKWGERYPKEWRDALIDLGYDFRDDCGFDSSFQEVANVDEFRDDRELSYSSEIAAMAFRLE